MHNKIFLIPLGKIQKENEERRREGRGRIKWLEI